MSLEELTAEIAERAERKISAPRRLNFGAKVDPAAPFTSRSLATLGMTLEGSPILHPGDAGLQTRMHRVGGKAHRPPVTGQDPFEAEREQALHRPDLLAP
jgi:hypothetical protein